MKRDKTLLGASLLAAITASLCCITPVLALIAGSSGLASTFSWIEPFRPYLIGLTIFIIGFAWYQKLKPNKRVDCECDEDEKPKFIQSKSFLGIVSVFAIMMMAFPFYSELFYPEVKGEIISADLSNIKTAEFTITGMTCSSCENHVNHEIRNLNGILSSKTSYENGNAVIEFDSTKISSSEIKGVINSTGYKVISETTN